MKKYSLWILFVIFIIALILRFFLLGHIPLGFHRDEAFLSYNAYSILKTGMDMSGNFLPLHLESFLYSPAGYSYFSIPFIFLFGLNEFSARFASRPFWEFYRNNFLFPGSGAFSKNRRRELLALISSSFLAISPWNIILSRTATENVIVVFFITLGTYIFLISLKKNNILLLVLGFFCYLITIFTYQGSRSFLPFFIPLLMIVYLYKKFRSRFFLTSGILYILFIIVPVIYVLLSPKLSTRVKMLSVFYSDQTRASLGQAYRSEGVGNVPLLITRVFHNKITGYSGEVITNYFKHFSFDFLFTDSYLPLRYEIPSHGLLYLFDIPLLIFGIWEIVKNRKKSGILLFGWVLIAPVGASLTFDDIPNMQRTLIMFPALSVISSLGFVTIYDFLRQKKSFLTASFLIILLSVSYFCLQYFVDSNFYKQWERQEGYKELVSKVNNLLPNYKYSVITNRESAPTIFFLFYDKYDPKTFQNETKNFDKEKTDSMNFYKYVFSQQQCPLRTEIDKEGNTKLFGERGILYVDSGLCDQQNGLNYISSINRKDGSIVFRIVDYREGNIKSE